MPRMLDSCWGYEPPWVFPQYNRGPNFPICAPSPRLSRALVEPLPHPRPALRRHILVQLEIKAGHLS